MITQTLRMYFLPHLQTVSGKVGLVGKGKIPHMAIQETLPMESTQ